MPIKDTRYLTPRRFRLEYRHPAKPRFASDVDTKKVGTVRRTSSVSKDKGNFRRKSNRIMVTEQRLAKINSVVSGRQEGIVVLEDIHDPHNAQAVIRSCDCFGIQTIYVIFQNEKQFNPERMGKLASSSANKWVDYKIFDSTQACFDQLKTDGYTSYATVLKPEALPLYSCDFAKPEEKIAIVFGNEHAGLTQEAMDLSDHLITVPMNGMIQSLNLSVTAAIFLFEINRQRRVAGFDKFVLGNQGALLKSMLAR